MAKYSVRASTQGSGELRATKKWYSSDVFHHVNDSGHATGYGSERQQTNRLVHRTRAIQDVKAALDASLAALRKADHPPSIQPSAVPGILGRFDDLGKHRGITVEALRGLVALEARGFEGGARAVLAALGLEASTSAHSSPRSRSAAAPASPQGSTPQGTTPQRASTPQHSSTSQEDASAQVNSPSQPDASSPKASDFESVPPRRRREGKHAGLPQARPEEPATVNLTYVSATVQTPAARPAPPQAQVHTPAPAPVASVAAAAAPAPVRLLPQQPLVKLARPSEGQARPVAQAAPLQADDIERQENAVLYFQDRYPVFQSELPLHALRVLILQIDRDKDHSHLLRPRVEVRGRRDYDPALVTAVDYIRARPIHSTIAPYELAAKALAEATGAKQQLQK